jgi:hypothetical protein
MHPPKKTCKFNSKIGHIFWQLQKQESKLSPTICLYVKNGEKKYYEKYLPLLVDTEADTPKVNDYQLGMDDRVNFFQCGSK